MKTIEELQDQLYCGKWENVMENIPPNSIDLIITSPPYNVLDKSKFKRPGYENHNDDMNYEDYLAWMETFFWACNIVLKEGGRLAINTGDKNNGRIPTHAHFIPPLNRGRPQLRFAFAAGGPPRGCRSAIGLRGR